MVVVAVAIGVDESLAMAVAVGYAKWTLDKSAECADRRQPISWPD